MSEDLNLEPLNKRLALLEALQARSYRFITPTPSTHVRVIARRSMATDLRGALGWSLPFKKNAIDEEIVDLLASLGALEGRDGLLKSKLRVSSLGDDLFLHSAFPTTQQDAVFFGPDSYRFAGFIAAELPKLGQLNSIVDIGAGTGVGAIAAARALERKGALPPIITSTDINPAALELAKANVLAAGVSGGFDFSETSGIGDVSPMPDCIIANPPYIADPSHRAYRDGGDTHGGEVSVRWAREAAARLERGSALLLYTGSAIVDGEDKLKAELYNALGGFDVTYREIDPDVFGEELEREDYADVERIAVVGLVAVKR